MLKEAQLFHLFIRFLKTNNIYNKFFIALNNDLNYRRIKNTYEFLGYHLFFSPHKLISDGFQWGVHYDTNWANYSKKWKYICKYFIENEYIKKKK